VDNAGNMISSATQRQIDDGVQTDYIYYLNRLTDVIYPMNPAYNVSYIYDDIGRVQRRMDATGYESFTYDAMGNVASSERLIALPNEGQSYVFRTHYKYDSFGKIQSITYPDQAIVTYNYRDGLLKSISGHHNQLNSNLYVSDILYNEYDQPIELYYGNGDYQVNNYDYARQWLVNKALHSGSGHHLQDLWYYYDAVGNILQIEQSASSADGLGGAYSVHYAYDPQNRLILAAQSSDELPNYSFDYSYSPAGRMNRKIRTDIGVEWYYGYKTNQDGQTYNHQIGTIFDGASGETALLSWNADGQLERISRPCYDEVRQHQWNEAGQMVLSVDNKLCGYYAYDAMGNRAYKLTGYTAMNQVNAGELHADLYFDYAVLYVNPYMTVTPRAVREAQEVIAHAGIILFSL
jgi:YD repeat-containing protein